MASSLMEMLMSRPSAMERYQQIQPLLAGGGFGSSFSAPSTPTATGDSSHWEDVARRIANRQYDWQGQDWRAIDSIIERESGWDPNALNEGSGAYGIPQILPSAHPGANLQGDPRGQIKWLMDYISGRYGDPMSALSFKDSHGWY